MASQVVCGLVFRLLLPVCLAAGKLKGLRNADFIACRVLLKIAAALTINKKKKTKYLCISKRFWFVYLELTRPIELET